MYNIPVAAVDGGGYTGYALIRVNVADIGDNTPKFRVHSYKANVYADAQIDNYVLQVMPRAMTLCYWNNHFTND